MDLKTDDILSYQLDKLSLENIPDDILEISDAISISNVHSDIENALSSLESIHDQSASVHSSKGPEKCTTIDASLNDDKCVTKQHKEINLDKSEKHKDINGNVEFASVENLNSSFGKLELSDSDNEETEKPGLRERAPIRTNKGISKNRKQNNLVRNEYDRSQFTDPHRLRTLSGARLVQVNDTRSTPCLLFNESDFASSFSESNAVSRNTSESSFYDNFWANSTHSSTTSQDTNLIFAPSASFYDEGFGANSTQSYDVPSVFEGFANSVSAIVRENESFNFNNSFYVDSNTNSRSSPECRYDFEDNFTYSSAAIQNEAAISASNTSFNEDFGVCSAQNEVFNQVLSDAFYTDFAVRTANSSQNESSKQTNNVEDTFHEDSSINFVSSPESGYDTSSPFSASCSPPHNISLVASEFILNPIAERLDEQEVLNFVLERSENDASIAHRLLLTSLDAKECKEKITYFLKDTQVEKSKISDVKKPVAPSETSNGNLESLLAELTQLNCGASVVNEGQTELNELSQLLPNEIDEYNGIVEVLNELSHAASNVNTENVQTELSEPPHASSVTNGEYFPAEASLPHIASSEARSEHVAPVTGLDLRNTSNVRITPVTSQNSSGTPIACMPVGDKAKTSLFRSLCATKKYAVQRRIFRKVIEDKNEGKELKLIYIEDEGEKTSENQTNLHRAVLNSNLEEIYYIIEGIKQFNLSSDLNLRDKHGKTALDYAIQKNLTLVIDYLKENKACPSLNI